MDSDVLYAEQSTAMSADVRKLHPGTLFIVATIAAKIFMRAKKCTKRAMKSIVLNVAHVTLQKRRTVMMNTYDAAKLTEFDCWCCRSIISCDHVGDMNCRATMFAVMACEMILDGLY